MKILQLSKCAKWAGVSIIMVMLLASGCALFSSEPEPLPPPEPENQAPVIHSITAETELLLSASSQIICDASDTDGDELNYWWSADKGMIRGEGDNITWIAPDIIGDYIIEVMASDGKGGETVDSITITVAAEPNQPPVVTAINVTLPDKPTITIGEPQEQLKISRWKPAKIECIAEDPNDDELSYIWLATGGRIQGEGNKVDWIAPPIADKFLVTVRVMDSNGSEVEDSVEFEVLCCGH